MAAKTPSQTRGGVAFFLAVRGHAGRCREIHTLAVETLTPAWFNKVAVHVIRSISTNPKKIRNCGTMKSSNIFCLAFGLLIACFAMQTATGQDRYVDGPWGWGGGYHHASTAAEGYQRGFADVVRSAGQYNLDTAQANNINQDTVSKYLDNRAKGTDTYFQMREANRQYRRQLETPPLSSEQLYRIAAEQRPDTLAASDLDPLTGDIAWPLVLQGEEYEEVRTKLEGLFALRAKEGSSSYVFEIQQTANEALAQLKANIRNYPAPEYLKAKKFLEALAFTARAPNL